MPTITNIHHIAITVTDVERSAAWYQDLLGMDCVLAGDEDTVRYRVLAQPQSGVVVGLRQYTDGSGDAFDELRTGLDHVAFGVTSAADLASWESELARRAIRFTPAVETSIGTVIVFRDPDDVQLEFWLPA